MQKGWNVAAVFGFALMGAAAGCASMKPVPLREYSVEGDGSGSLKLSWSPNKEKNIAAYNIYWMAVPGVYGDPISINSESTHFEIRGLDKGRRYFVAITAVNSDKQESPKSEEVTKVAE